MNTPGVSVVIPVFRNRNTVGELARRIRLCLGGNPDGCEIIFVNDACPDGSLGGLLDIARDSKDVTVLDLDRNRGQHRAVLAGLACVRGPLAAVMDADLQDPPEALPELIRELDHGPYSVVFGGRRGYYESASRLATSKLFKLALNAATGLPADTGMFFAMNRKARERILSLHSRQPFVTVLIGCSRLPVSSIPVQRNQRPDGVSSYTGGMRFRAGMNAMACIARYRLGLDNDIPTVGEEAVRAIRARYGAGSVAD